MPSAAKVRPAWRRTGFCRIAGSALCAERCNSWTVVTAVKRARGASDAEPCSFHKQPWAMTAFRLALKRGRKLLLCHSRDKGEDRKIFRIRSDRHLPDATPN